MIRTRLTRRTALGTIAGTLAFPAVLRAQSFPGKTISFICAFPAGGTADVLARFVTEAVARVSGHTIIVENKPGAAGNIAAQYTARAKPDGHTVLIHAGSTIAANMWLFKNPPVDVTRELETIATINRQCFMLMVRADSPYKTVADLVAGEKEKGDKSSYAWGATPAKIMMEQFKHLAGLETVGVQYKVTGDIVNDFYGGLVDIAAADPVFATSHSREGRSRVLAIALADRLVGRPDLPTFKEQGYDIDQPVWWGAMVPAGVPDDVKNTINGWFREALADPKVVEFLQAQGGDANISTPEESQQLMLNTVNQWKDLVQIAGIEPQ